VGFYSALRGGEAVHSNKIWESICRLYDNVELALWSLLLSGIICFGAFVVPNLSKIWARAEAQRTLEVAKEDSYYCKKWNMTVGSGKYHQCMFDLGELRTKIEKRIYEENEF
jgi:hypothetical protein